MRAILSVKTERLSFALSGDVCLSLRESLIQGSDYS